MKELNIATSASYYGTPLVCSKLLEQDIIVTTQHYAVDKIRYMLRAQGGESLGSLPTILAVDHSERNIIPSVGVTPWLDNLTNGKSYRLPKDEDGHFVKAYDFAEWGAKFIVAHTCSVTLKSIGGFSSMLRKWEQVDVVSKQMNITNLGELGDIRRYADKKYDTEQEEDPVVPSMDSLVALSPFSVKILLKRVKRLRRIQKLEKEARTHHDHPEKANFPAKVYRDFDQLKADQEKKKNSNNSITMEELLQED